MFSKPINPPELAFPALPTRPKMEQYVNSDQITLLFTRTDGSYLCARGGPSYRARGVWGRLTPHSPCQGCALSGRCHAGGPRETDMDPELAANLPLVFFVRGLVRIDRNAQSGPADPGNSPPSCPRFAAVRCHQTASFAFDARGASTPRSCCIRRTARGWLTGARRDPRAVPKRSRRFLLWSDYLRFPRKTSPLRGHGQRHGLL